MNSKKYLRIFLMLLFFVMIHMVSVNAASIEDITFDSEFYNSVYSDLNEAYHNDASKLREHYINYGIKEGRQASPYFNVKFYLKANPDVANAFGSENYEAAYNHFANYGLREGRFAVEGFNVRYYVEANADVKAAYPNDFASSYYHFVFNGVKEGRTLTVAFNPREYAAVNADINEACKGDFKAIYNHFIKYGIKEARTLSSNFNTGYYVANNADVAKAYGEKNFEDAYEHYVLYGLNEPRPTFENHVHDFDYEKPEYKWSEDNKTCVVEFTCKEDATHKETVNMTVTYKEVTPGSCETNTPGKGRYTATVEHKGKTYKEQSEEVEVPAEHDFDEEQVWDIPATCRADGYYGKLCKNEGKMVVIESRPATGHNYTVTFNWDEEEDYTAGNKPTVKAVVVCANEEVDPDDEGITIDADNVVLKTYTEGNCGATASAAKPSTYAYEVSYELPSEVYDEEKDTVKFVNATKTYSVKVEHTLGEATYKKLANGDVEKTSACTICGYAEKETIHNVKEVDENNAPTTYYDETEIETVAGTCQAKGYVVYDNCKNCKKTYRKETDYGTHNTTSVAAIEGSCKDKIDAIAAHHLCNTCGEWFATANAARDAEALDKSENITSWKELHETTYHEATTKTCDTPGNIEYWQCDVCDKCYTDEDCVNEIEKSKTEIKAGHSINYVAAKAATCEEEGNKAYYECALCEKYFSDAAGKTEIVDKSIVTIAAKDHTWEHHDAIAGSCTTKGQKEYWQCTVCKNLYVETTGSASVDATIKNDDNTTTNLTKVEGRDDLVDQSGVTGKHATLAYKAAKAATCTEAGNKEGYYCSTCDKYFTTEAATTEVENAVIPATGHSWVVDNAGSCLEDATVHCSNEDCDADLDDMTDEEAKDLKAKDAHTSVKTYTVTEDGVVYVVTDCSDCKALITKGSYELTAATVKSSTTEASKVTAFTLTVTDAAAENAEQTLSANITEANAEDLGIETTVSKDAKGVYTVSVKYAGYTYTLTGETITVE